MRYISEKSLGSLFFFRFKTNVSVKPIGHICRAHIWHRDNCEKRVKTRTEQQIDEMAMRNQCVQPFKLIRRQQSFSNEIIAFSMRCQSQS